MPRFRFMRDRMSRADLVEARDRALAERSAAITERDRALAERSAAITERDGALAERNTAIAERNTALTRLGRPLTTDLLTGLRQKPWYSVELPEVVSNAKGMIYADERRMLYTLARDYFTGVGQIIDGGAWVGASSLSLGFGLKDRGYQKEPLIHAFDNFILDEGTVAQGYLSHDEVTNLNVKHGDNIRFIYERNIDPISEYVTIHEGDLRQSPWQGGPIEILFSDISKSWLLNDYIITNWLSSLLPETGILVQQDQVQEWHVWVAITMEMLANYFEFIDFTFYNSAVYRLKREIPLRSLDKCLSVNISSDEMEYYYLNFLERFRRMEMGRFKGMNLGMVEAGLVVTYAVHIGDLEKARRALHECEEKFYHIPDTMSRLAGIKNLVPNL